MSKTLLQLATFCDKCINALASDNDLITSLQTIANKCERLASAILFKEFLK